jgi:hypothetical protein
MHGILGKLTKRLNQNLIEFMDIAKANPCGLGNIHKFLSIRLGAFLYKMHGILGKLTKRLNQNLIESLPPFPSLYHSIVFFDILIYKQQCKRS